MLAHRTQGALRAAVGSYEDDGSGDEPRVGLSLTSLDFRRWEQCLSSVQTMLKRLLATECKKLLFEQNKVLTPKTVVLTAITQIFVVPISEGGAGLMLPTTGATLATRGACRSSTAFSTRTSSRSASTQSFRRRTGTSWATSRP